MADTSASTGHDGAERAFLSRMERQCEAIEQYRLDVLKNEHRQLSEDQAAMEWIARYAESFARDHDGRRDPPDNH